MLINLLMFAHVLISILLILLVLLQRSDGGLGSLGGSGSEALMTVASAGDALSRMTKWLFVIYIALTLGLAVQMAGTGTPKSVVLEEGQSTATPVETTEPAFPTPTVPAEVQ